MEPFKHSIRGKKVINFAIVFISQYHFIAMDFLSSGEGNHFILVEWSFHSDHHLLLRHCLQLGHSWSKKKIFNFPTHQNNTNIHDPHWPLLCSNQYTMVNQIIKLNKKHLWIAFTCPSTTRHRGVCRRHWEIFRPRTKRELSMRL